ncbi:hypothetical protein MKX03_019329 [Papaver bracteatum]|nr:hypothetical protein MKX03_019329 [Papaver bracteatum]
MTSSKSSSQIGLILFAILALSVYFGEIPSVTAIVVKCRKGETRVVTQYHRIVGPGNKCTAVARECANLCKSQGRTARLKVCLPRGLLIKVYACIACCAAASPPPPPPPTASPPPPPPPTPSPPPPPPPTASPPPPATTIISTTTTSVPIDLDVV